MLKGSKNINISLYWNILKMVFLFFINISMKKVVFLGPFCMNFQKEFFLFCQNVTYTHCRSYKIMEIFRKNFRGTLIWRPIKIKPWNSQYSRPMFHFFAKILERFNIENLRNERFEVDRNFF